MGGVQGRLVICALAPLRLMWYDGDGGSQCTTFQPWIRERPVKKMGYSTDVLLCLVMLAGCAGKAYGRFLVAKDGHFVPRGRVGCFASPTLGTHYLDPCNLGPHSYRLRPEERSGILYTCRGGHIDVTHVRKAADWAAYLGYQTRKALLRNVTYFSYAMAEPSKYHVRIQYPEDWASLSRHEKRETATRVANGLGQYFAFAGATWHEMLTWFGFKSTGLYSEFPSAFSWEDSYSNLLGTHLAGLALADPNRSYDEAMTVLLDRELHALQVQPGSTAWQAAEAVRDWWYVGNFFFCDMVKRNFDIGTDDGFITPWLVPDITPCQQQQPKAYPVPDLAFTKQYGFSVRLEIEPREWEKDKILRAVYRDSAGLHKRLEPALHFGPLIEYIRAQAIRLYGPYVAEAGTSVPGGEVFPASRASPGTTADMQAVPCDCDGFDSTYHGPDRSRRPDVAIVAAFAACWLVEEASFMIADVAAENTSCYSRVRLLEEHTGRIPCGK